MISKTHRRTANCSRNVHEGSFYWHSTTNSVLVLCKQFTTYCTNHLLRVVVVQLQCPLPFHAVETPVI